MGGRMGVEALLPFRPTEEERAEDRSANGGYPLLPDTSRFHRGVSKKRRLTLCNEPERCLSSQVVFLRTRRRVQDPEMSRYTAPAFQSGKLQPESEVRTAMSPSAD